MAATRPAAKTLFSVADDGDYPTVDVSSGVFTGAYFASVSPGADEIVSSLRQLEECVDPVGGYVLVGCSQGSDVVRQTIEQLEPEEQDRIDGVVCWPTPGSIPISTRA